MNKNNFAKDDKNIQKKDTEFTNFFNSVKSVLFDNHIEYPEFDVFGKTIVLKLSVKNIINKNFSFIGSLISLTWWITLCSWIIYDIKNIINKMKNGSILENNNNNVGGDEL